MSYSYPNLPWFSPQISVDSSTPGQSYTLPPQLTPFGRFHTPASQDEVNPGYGVPQPAAPDVRTRLQTLLAGAHPGVGNFLGDLHKAQPAPFEQHHAMVNAASNLARLLAGQSHAGLRRFQYNGRH